MAAAVSYGFRFGFGAMFHVGYHILYFGSIGSAFLVPIFGFGDYILGAKVCRSNLVSGGMWFACILLALWHRMIPLEGS